MLGSGLLSAAWHHNDKRLVKRRTEKGGNVRKGLFSASLAVWSEKGECNGKQTVRHDLSADE